MIISYYQWMLLATITLVFSLWFHHNYLTPIPTWNYKDWLFLFGVSIFYPVGIFVILVVLLAQHFKL